jgi:tetratricopeptide (TPR) repeat protein
MDPLSQRDLLIRKQTPEAGDWGGENKPPGEVQPNVPLERFQTLERVVRDNPLTSQPYLELARIYMEGERWGDAKRVLDQAVARFDDEPVLFLREEAQLRRALQLLHGAEVACQEEPSRGNEENLERSRVQLNVLRQQVCEARLSRHPEQLELNVDLAIALDNLGQRDRAIEVLQRVIVEPRLRAAAALQLGHCFARARQIPQALSAYRRAALFRAPPPSPEIKLAALTAAANLAEKSRMIDSARRYVAMLVELQPNNVDHKARLQRLQATPL